MLRWAKRLLAGLLVIVVIAVGAVYIQSNRIINRRYAFHEHPIALPTDSVSLVQGYRFAKMHCFGCHGDSLQGNAAFFDEPNIARLVSANIPKALTTLTNAELAGLLRSGVRKDGTSPFVMPPRGFYHISDQDLGALIAYLRSLPVPQNDLPPNSYRILGRVGLVMGQMRTAAADFDTTQERVGQDPAWATARHGEYLARLTCSGCHGSRLTGDPAPEGGTTPSPALIQALGYSLEEFRPLLRTGTPREAGKQLGMMRDAARRMLNQLSDEEIGQIYAYLKTMPAKGAY
jgi:mono/diheme cytochrome c family protein